MVVWNCAVRALGTERIAARKMTLLSNDRQREAEGSQKRRIQTTQKALAAAVAVVAVVVVAAAAVVGAFVY